MRSMPASIVALMIAAALPALPSSLSASPLDFPPDSTGVSSPWHIQPANPCVDDSVFMIVRGYVATPCDSFLGAEALTSSFVRIRQQVRVELACFAGPTIFYPVPLALGRFAAGAHSGIVEVVTIQLREDGTSTTTTERFPFGFEVTADCPIPPPPAPGPLPYVNRITVSPHGICGPEPICPGDSILVQVSGVFPHNCFSFRRIQLIPSPLTVVPPPPPTVRIIVDNGGCLGRPCVNVPVPWSAAVVLPPMVTGGYELGVELAEVSCSDTYPPGQLHHASVPLRVVESCPTQPACLTGDFAPGPDGLSACNATIAIGRPAELTFLVRPTVALAGLQGAFRLDTPGPEITRLEAIGPAAGMLLDWTATADGARFVLFAPSGAPIPPVPARDTREIAFGGWPVLRVTVEHLKKGAPPPDRTVLTADNLLGSDIDGRAVVLCPPPPCVDADLRLLAGRALICGERACDFNADGLQDVRDLVLMVHCVTGEGGCPPDVDTRFDCDGDGAFALADVLCCARHVLQRPPCQDCPPDTAHVRPEPGVAVSFGEPRETLSGVALPLEVAGAGLLGAAMLTLEAPLDRYDVVGFDASPPGNWLTLHEVKDGRIVLGLVGLRNPSRFDPLEGSVFTLTLALRLGQAAGGQVVAVAGDFSGPDGIALGVDLGRPSQLLPGAAQVALGASHPNPFSIETTFTLDLATRVEVVVGIYDLRGRAVATLHRGPLGPGPHPFRWDGRSADGNTAPNGVYFYRATVGAGSYARKLILMRGE